MSEKEIVENANLVAQIAVATSKPRMMDAPVLEQARYAVDRLLFNHPDTAIFELRGLLERVDAQDAEVSQAAIARLEGLAAEIEEVEHVLRDTLFNFGCIAGDGN
jgi:hypothetical protein